MLHIARSVRRRFPGHASGVIEILIAISAVAAVAAAAGLILLLAN